MSAIARARLRWNLWKEMPAPSKGLSLQDHLKLGLWLRDGRRAQGEFTVVIGDSEPIKDLNRFPTETELKQDWQIVAVDHTAFEDMLTLLKQLATEALQEEQRTTRIVALFNMTADSVPSLLSGEASSSPLPEVFTNCAISQISQLPALPNEDALVAEMRQAKHAKPPIQDGNTTKAFHPFFQKQLQLIEIVERINQQNASNNNSSQFRVNKLLHEPKEERQGEKQGEQDYTCTIPNKDVPCFFNTLFYLQALPCAETTEQTQEEGKKEQATDYILRKGVARVVSRIMEKKIAFSTQIRGLGVVCDGTNVLFVQVDLTEQEEGKFPVYLSQALPLNSEEGLRNVARFLCSSAEQFGLSSLFEMQQRLPLAYVRALGSGGFADVVVVRDEAGHELACKLDRGDIVTWQMLICEGIILKKLQDIATGVPRVVSPDDDEGASEARTKF